MTLLNDFSTREVQFYLSSAYPCSYLPGRMARSLVATPNELVDSTVYDELIRLGFRRSGTYNYRPQCSLCEACVPVRLIVDEFRKNRTQHRAWKALSGLRAVPRELTYKPEHHELYLRYQATRHAGGGMDQDDREQYERFLLQSHVATHLIEFREGDVLRMVSLIDKVSDGLSSVYTFYDPDLPRASFGTYNILWQAALCRELGLPYLYLGYWVEHSRKMTYKINYQPLEGLIEGRWQRLPPKSELTKPE
ncbi:MAG: arginyltransferase [Betaproteobacteria bacterium]|nr:arginyltransferase [Betaproteobacteria bacterium]